jgi:tetratricopeptide (TPR) repeat protein
LTLITHAIIYFSSSILSDDEIQAQNFVKRGKIDETIAIYQRLKPDSAGILNIIDALYAEKKGDYDSAINYYEKALQIQEKVYR